MIWSHPPGERLTLYAEIEERLAGERRSLEEICAVHPSLADYLSGAGRWTLCSWATYLEKHYLYPLMHLHGQLVSCSSHLREIPGELGSLIEELSAAFPDDMAPAVERYAAALEARDAQPETLTPLMREAFSALAKAAETIDDKVARAYAPVHARTSPHLYYRARERLDEGLRECIDYGFKMEMFCRRSGEHAERRDAYWNEAERFPFLEKVLAGTKSCAARARGLEEWFERLKPDFSWVFDSHEKLERMFAAPYMAEFDPFVDIMEEISPYPGNLAIFDRTLLGDVLSRRKYPVSAGDETRIRQFFSSLAVCASCIDTEMSLIFITTHIATAPDLFVKTYARLNADDREYVDYSLRTLLDAGALDMSELDIERMLEKARAFPAPHHSLSDNPFAPPPGAKGMSIYENVPKKGSWQDPRLRGAGTGPY